MFSTDALYTDLNKEFDSISHKKFITKMRAYGINQNVCARLEDLLLTGVNVLL